ncbi:MAG: hypothetical protein JXR84_10210 [Anaerolineae bacterium]|nr:hypothetical protein [Anaerolineae bacterium]
MPAKKLLTILALATLVYLASPSPVYAYLDPGTGSFIFQLVVAGLAGAAFIVKMYWGKIKTLFAKLFSKNDQRGEEEIDG